MSYSYDTIDYGIGIWGTFANIFFFFAAMWSDLLLIRLSLTLAYIFLLVDGLTGLPSHYEVANLQIHWLPWGFVFWSVLTGVFHFVSLMIHILDERPIKFQGDEEELYRCFYRRSGMGRLEFKEVLRRGYWNRYKAGDTIYVKGVSESCLHIIVDGVVSLHMEDEPHKLMSLHSGEMWNCQLLNLMGIYLGFDTAADSIQQAMAKTDCQLFTWHASQVSEIAFGSPSVSGFWRNFILYAVGSDFMRRDRHKFVYGRDCYGHPEDAAWADGARTRDMTKPFQPHELPSWSAKAVLTWLWDSLSPIPPVGLRHLALPPSSIATMARQRAFINQGDGPAQ